MALLEKAITTQEELDAVIGERLTRKAETVRKEFDGYISPADLETKTKDLNKQVAALSKQIEDDAKKYAGYDAELAKRDEEIKKYETASVKSRIADEVGLDRRLIDRLAGEKEEDIRKDAESLKALFGGQQQTLPLASTEHSEGDAVKAAWSKTIAGMKG